MPPLLLLTRPTRQSERFAARAHAVLPPHEVLIAPLSQVVPLPYDPTVFERARGIVLTSANAVPMLPALPGLPAWCVGPATTAAARCAGFDARDGGGDAAALIETLAAECPDGPLVHAHGDHLARDLVATLRPRGLDLRSVAVYAARALDWPEALAKRLAGAERVLAPLFSPRAAERFVRNLSRIQGLNRDSIIPVAISDACAKRLPEGLRRAGLVAEAPHAEAMLAALGQAFADQGSHPGASA